jgi:tetratricopeptide (TPR) repeat protein
MSDEPNWLEFYQDRERTYADVYLAFAQDHAQRTPAAHGQLQAELSNLLNAADWLREQADWRGLIRLTAAMWEDSSFLPDRGPAPQVLSMLEGGLEAARVLDDAVATGARLDALGETLRGLGKVEQAIDLHDEALTLARQVGDLATVRTALCRLGLAWIDRDVSKALPILIEAEGMSEVTTDPAMEIDLLSALATAYTQQGQTDLAAGYLEQALGLAQREQDLRRWADLLQQRGYLRSVVGDLQNARTDFQEAAALFERLAHALGHGRALQAMGVITVQLGQVEQGLDELERAIQIHRQAGDNTMMPLTLVALGQTYVALGQLERARSHLESALEMIVGLKTLPRVAALEAPVCQLLESIQV